MSRNENIVINIVYLFFIVEYYGQFYINKLEKFDFMDYIFYI